MITIIIVCVLAWWIIGVASLVLSILVDSDLTTKDLPYLFWLGFGGVITAIVCTIHYIEEKIDEKPDIVLIKQFKKK